MHRIIATVDLVLYTNSNRSSLDLAAEFVAWMEDELFLSDSSTNCELHSASVERARDGGEVEDKPA